MNKSRIYLSYLYIILSAVFWGSLCVFAKGLQDMGLNSFQTSLVRALVSLIFISILILIRNKSLFKINPRDVWMFFGTGCISFFLCNVCYFSSIRLAGAAVASVLLYTAPIFVTVMSCFLFGEKMTYKKLFCLVLAVGGCALVSGIASGNIGDLPVAGILTGLGSGLAYALYSIFSTIALRKYNALTVTFYTFAFGTVSATIIGTPTATFTTIANPTGILLGLGLGIIAGALPYFLYTLGLTKVKTSHASVIATVEPVVASLLGIFLLNDKYDEFTIMGIAAILSASLLLNTKSKKE